jgi:hypothetical protein
MTGQLVSDLKTPISEILKAAGADGLLLETEGQARYALIPLDEDLIDYLIECSPKFIEVCRQIRVRMAGGGFHAHAAVKALLDGNNQERGTSPR